MRTVGERLDGAAALVIGGATGLGFAAAQRLHERGAVVIVGDIGIDQARSAAESISSERVLPIQIDVAEWSSVSDAAAYAAKAAPRGLRVLVNTAGIVGNAELVTEPGVFDDTDEFQRMITINLLGTLNSLRAAATVMAAGDPDDRDERGVCITTASIAAFDGAEKMTAYAASKAGVAGLTLPAARELAAHGIRVVAIAPGWFETPMTATKPGQRPAQVHTVPFPSRFGRPVEYADLVEHIVDNQMLNGSVIRLDAALRLQRRSD